MLFSGLGLSVWEKLRPCIGLENGPRPTVSGRTQDLGHSFFPIRTSRSVNNIYLFFSQGSERAGCLNPRI